MTESTQRSQVLIVDDSKVIRRAAAKILEKEFSLLEAEDGLIAWQQIQNNKNISVVFTDLGMPNMDGFELLENIRNSEDPEISNLPVIVITGAEESEGAKEEVLKKGATDFISKPFNSPTLKSRAQAHIHYRNEVKALEKRVAVDKLTGLTTEVAFNQLGSQALAYAARHGTDITVVRFDIVGFSEIFVKHGKDISEQILAKVASFILQGMRTEDTAARLGVARFALLLPSADYQGATTVVSRICQRVAKLKLKLGNDVFHIRFSTGLTSPSVDNNALKFEDILEQAEHALRQSLQQNAEAIVCYQDGSQAINKKIRDVEINIEDLLLQLGNGKNVDDEQLASAMRKFMPLMQQADKALKLGLSKVVLHLLNKLKIQNY